MLDRPAAVLDERQRKRRLVLKVFAALPADDHPAPVLGGRGVVLKQDRLAHTAKAGQPDVARKGGKTCEVLVEARELCRAVRQVGWVQPHPRPERVGQRRMITF